MSTHDLAARIVFRALLATMVFFPLPARAAEVVTRFRETDESFANPGQGWMTTRRMPDGPGRFPYSVAYFRLNWEDVEPAENEYVWERIDEPLEARLAIDAPHTDRLYHVGSLRVK